MNAALRLFRKKGIFNEDEIRIFRDKYKNGCHVHLTPITGGNNEVLFRTAEYLAAGYFHNSMIISGDHENAKLTFRYKSRVDRKTKEKIYSEMTMDIYDSFDEAQDKFMVRMLFYLPDKHWKEIRYDGIYAHGIGKKLDEIPKRTLARAIENSFDTNPEICPVWGREMIPYVVFSYFAEKGGSIIMTSNKPFSKWTELMSDEAADTAVFDHLLYHAHVLSLKGDSYRMKDRLKVGAANFFNSF
jgi:hypothetical protein